MSAVTPKRRAVASKVTFSISSLVRFQADLFSARPTDKTDFKTLCPDCEHPQGVSERFTCEKGHGPFTRSQLKHGREIDKTLYATTEEDYAAVKAPTIDKEQPVEVRVFDAKSVTNHVRPTGSSYVLRPLIGAEATYVALVSAVEDKRRAFLTELVIRGSQKLFQIEVWNGCLVLQELVRPSELAQVESIQGKAAKDEVALMRKLIESKVEPFEASQFRSLAQERVAALDERLLSAKITTKRKSKVTDGGDLLAALQASVAADNMTRKAPTKRAKVTPIKKAS